MIAYSQDNYPKTVVIDGDTITMLRFTDAKFLSEQYEFAKQFREELHQKNLSILKFKKAKTQNDAAFEKLEKGVEALSYSNADLKKVIDVQGDQISSLKTQKTIGIVLIGILTGLLIIK